MAEHYPKGRSDRVAALIKADFHLDHWPSKRGKHAVQCNRCRCYLNGLTAISAKDDRNLRFSRGSGKVPFDLAEDDVFLCAWRHRIMCLGERVEGNTVDAFSFDPLVRDAMIVMRSFHRVVGKAAGVERVIEELGRVLADWGYDEAADALQFAQRRTKNDSTA